MSSTDLDEEFIEHDPVALRIVLWGLILFWVCVLSAFKGCA